MTRGEKKEGIIRASFRRKLCWDARITVSEVSRKTRRGTGEMNRGFWERGREEKDTRSRISAGTFNV